jgi:hypothetical protein
MTHEQRTARIKILARELSTLLEEESPRPAEIAKLDARRPKAERMGDASAGFTALY